MNLFRKRDILVRGWRADGFPEIIINSFISIPREHFVPESLVDLSYDDVALPLINGQTISQPSTIIRMISLLDVHGDHSVLEVGTGSGYTAAILSKMCRRVVSVEIDEDLASCAIRNLELLGVRNVDIFVGDGRNGFGKFSPYDRIIVNACSKHIPKMLVGQLRDGGILVIPLGVSSCVMNRCVKTGGVLNCSEHGFYSFVPLL